MKKCVICENEFKPKSIINKYCSIKCKYIAGLEKRSNKPKPKTKTCKHCNKEFKPYTSLDKYCRVECRVENIKSKRKRNWSKGQCEKRVGKNNPAYRNGYYAKGNKKTNEGMRLFDRNKKEIIQSMLDDVGYVYCQHCNTSNSLRWESHHIIYRSEKPKHKNLHDKENIIHLCVKCHNEFHKNKNKRSYLIKERSLDKIFGNDILLNRI